MMQIAQGVMMLELRVQSFGRESMYHPVVIAGEQGTVLIDTGTPGQWEPIQNAMTKVGIDPETLQAVIITHQDIDHIGSLPEIKQALSHRVRVYAHPIEKPYIEGEKTILKFDRNQMPPERWASLPDAMKQLAARLPKAPVDETVTDGCVLPYGGITVIETPGHTPGHISLYSPKHRLLIAGDALTAEDGRLYGPNPAFTPDMDEAMRSVRKLLDFDIETVVCYHGGACRGDIRKQLERIVSSMA
ncbi:MBL fold metallo-hydrolase [Geobacillus sp. BK01]|uniref:MBL fold metallo-hydrolase n=1 Tax=Geobacillus sp. BK01 TaxID=3457328 RepID=UPI003FA614F6